MASLLGFAKLARVTYQKNLPEIELVACFRDRDFLFDVLMLTTDGKMALTSARRSRLR